VARRSTAEPIADERLTALGLFFEAHAGLTRELERRLDRDCGLSVQWFEVLLRLARTPEGRLRMSDLAGQTTLTPSGLTRAVDRLEAAGLVRREACPTDRRSSYACITDEGRARIEAAVPVHLGHIDDVVGAVLDTGELDALASTCRKLRDGVAPAPTCPSIDPI
jgi:DNA-binding MarR family transcriptional regulator